SHDFLGCSSTRLGNGMGLRHPSRWIAIVPHQPLRPNGDILIMPSDPLNLSPALLDNKNQEELFIRQTHPVIQKIICRVFQAMQISSTPDDVWMTLMLSIPLLKEYPNLGSVILEGEGWVNNQLKRLK
ncbi:hypothetical protein, partial [Herpetosiphon gulosus]|uniref:hypothetical protein n=1 Tax=Herpetosiphon gulosus TaxID=1973496 RepID=UPI0031E893E0